jgi:hypothetical protein
MGYQNRRRCHRAIQEASMSIAQKIMNNKTDMVQFANSIFYAIINSQTEEKEKSNERSNDKESN